MHTEVLPEAPARRRRRLHSPEFKAEAVKACQQAGVSMAAVAMARGINANLLRRWVQDAESDAGPRDGAVAALGAPPVPASTEFVALKVQDQEVQRAIRIELRRGAMSASVNWPTAAAAQCAAWLRELLR